MNEKKDLSRKIRRGQVIDVFGVGGIWEADGESFVACDLTRWRPTEPPDEQVIELRRLSGYLSGKMGAAITRFRSPMVPAAGEGQPGEIRNEEKIPYFRFPQWLVCSNPECNRMTRWNENNETGRPPECEHRLTEGLRDGELCRGLLAPVRLILICPQGHMQDIPWSRWLHRGRGETDEQREHRDADDSLVMRQEKEGGGSLYSVVVECEECGASGSLGELLEVEKWPCEGRHPWNPTSSREECSGEIEITNPEKEGEPPVRITAALRGDANVYFPIKDFALDIPPESRAGGWVSPWAGEAAWEKILSRCRAVSGWEEMNDTNIRIDIEDFADEKKKELECGTLQEAVAKVVAQIRQTLSPVSSWKSGQSLSTLEDLRYGEWRAFVEAEESFPGDNFRVERVDPAVVELSDFKGDSRAIGALREKIGGVRLCKRLREVRALRGFSRVGVGEDYPVVPVALGQETEANPVNWLPAVENFGEGIFISFEAAAIKKWYAEQSSFISERFDPLPGRLHRSRVAEWIHVPCLSPRFIMLHTLAHLLIKQLAFECGYPAASLREIIYCGEDEEEMAGILVYTAAGGAGGSLGGLVSQGHPERLLPVLLEALRRAQWCSSDPLCRRFPGQGRDGLNRAACHACSLLAETSCGHGNVLLDRMLVIGEGGFFSGYDETSISG